MAAAVKASLPTVCPDLLHSSAALECAERLYTAQQEPCSLFPVPCPSHDALEGGSVGCVGSISLFPADPATLHAQPSLPLPLPTPFAPPACPDPCSSLLGTLLHTCRASPQNVAATAITKGIREG